jgi:hypothetical protein
VTSVLLSQLVEDCSHGVSAGSRLASSVIEMFTVTGLVS